MDFHSPQYIYISYLFNLKSFMHLLRLAEQDHRYEVRSRINCLYCHCFHEQKEMLDGICPKMRAYAQQQHQKYAFICSKCQGEGSFQERVEIKILQSAKKFQQRLQKWFQDEQNGLSQHFPPPQRKIIRTIFKQTTITCDECNGKGRILRTVLEKIESHINNKKSSVCQMNPVWLQYRMKPIIVEIQFNCLICSKQAKLSQQSFRLGCTHQFHYKCIATWLQLSQKCPICKQIDPFIDLHYIQINHQEKYAVKRTQSELLASIFEEPIRIQVNLENQYQSICNATDGSLEASHFVQQIEIAQEALIHSHHLSDQSSAVDYSRLTIQTSEEALDVVNQMQNYGDINHI